MKRYQTILVACLTLLLVSPIFGQNSESLAEKDTPSAAEDAATLRLKLFELQEKEGALQNRLLQLDEDLKPENIERAVAGYGSTRPEELREQRRRELDMQKKGVVEQLGQLAVSRANLEAAIVNADALAYQQSAKGFPLDMVGLESRSAIRLALVAGLIAAIGIAGLFVIARRMRSRKV